MLELATSGVRFAGIAVNAATIALVMVTAAAAFLLATRLESRIRRVVAVVLPATAIVHALAGAWFLLCMYRLSEAMESSAGESLEWVGANLFDALHDRIGFIGVRPEVVVATAPGSATIDFSMSLAGWLRSFAFVLIGFCVAFAVTLSPTFHLRPVRRSLMGWGLALVTIGIGLWWGWLARGIVAHHDVVQALAEAGG